MKSPNVVFIGQQNIGEAIARFRDTWNFVGNYKNLSKFWYEITEKRLDIGSVDLVIILDNLCSNVEEDENGNPKTFDSLFEQTVDEISRYCMVAILDYGENRQALMDRISKVAKNYNRYYFISKDSFNSTLDEAIKDYARRATGAHLPIASRLLGVELKDSSSYALEEASGGFTVSGGVNPDEKIGEHLEEKNENLGTVVTVTSSKGGAGKTSVALSLAAYISLFSRKAHEKGVLDRPLKVCVVDSDIEDSQVGFLVGATRPTMADLLIRGYVDKEGIEECKYVATRLGVDTILGPRMVNTASQISPAFFEELILCLRKMYDYVIVDTSIKYNQPLYSEVIYPMSSVIIYVTDIVIQSMLSMARWRGLVLAPKANGGFGISPNQVGVVINKSIDNVAMSPSQIRKALGPLNPISVVPNSAKLFAHASNTNSLEVVLKHPQILQSIKRIADPILQADGIVFDPS